MFRSTMFIALATASSTMASPVFDNGMPNFDDGSEITMYVQAEDFILDANASVTAASFNLLTFDPINSGGLSTWDGTLQWVIYEQIPSGDQPGAILAWGPASGVDIDPIGNINRFEFFTVSFDLGQAVDLTAGAEYYFGLHMAADYSERDNLFWGITEPDGSGAHFGMGPTGPWGPSEREHAFTLYSNPSGAPCNNADVAEEFGVLDLADMNAFIGAFLSMDELADIVDDGIYDLLDITAFIDAFKAGCP